MAQRDVQMENLLNSILQKFSECSDGSGNLREDREQEMSLFLRDRLERVTPERMNELLKKLVNIGSTKIIECIANIDITIRLLVTYNIRTALHDSLKAKVQPPIDALSKIYGHVNYSALDEEGCTISHLHVAVKEKCAAAVANLLKWETSEIAFEEFKKNFSYLIKYDGRETLEVLLQTGFKSDEYVNEKRRTPLSHLCRRISEHRYYYGTTPEPGDDVAAIRLLVQYGANVNSTDANGRTPLMVLFNSGITEVDKQLDIARLLLDNGAEVNRCDENGETILHVVLRVWHLEEYHGPSHDPRRRNEPCLRVLKLLLERGAVINARNHDGQTPLLIAVVYCNLDAVELLLGHGANLGGVNFSGGYMEPSNGFLRNLEMTQNAIAILKLLESRGFTIRISSTMTWLHFLMGFLPSQKYYEARYVLAYVEDPERIRKYFDYIPNIIEDNEELDEEYTRRSEKVRHAMIAIIEIDNYLNVFNELRLPVSAKMISVLEHTGRELINKYNLSYIDATTDDEFRSYVIEQRSIDEELRRAEVTQISETATLLDVCRHSSEAAYEKLKISNYESVLEDYDNFKTNFPYIGIYLKGCITKALVKGQFKEKTRKMSMKNPA
ncbi:uncharacterized protein LOC106650404 [Trichogramma pretiosum]|uniref:uncharacterized protein LOC106650404 n=1 Tax=Trichogramma pretiosum TaxID=7493 RepID=UPI0006C9D3D4|nr:uncharacterized protein LOC106650404 [Trichogramma pretiosum]